MPVREVERRVVFFGTYDDALHPRVRSLIDGMHALGHEVIEVVEPSGVSTAERVAIAKRPWKALGIVGSSWAQRRRLRRAARSCGRADLVVVGYLGVFDAPRAARWFDAPVVLDHLAPVAETLSDRGAHPIVRIVGRLIDRRAERVVDLVAVDTDEARELVRHGSRVVTVPVGCGNNWFEAGDRRRASGHQGPLRVIFYGLFTPLQGIGTIVEAAAATASDDIAWTIVGQGQEGRLVEPLIGRAGIELLPWCEPADLPELLARHDVCLGVFGAGSKARRVVPNKVVQGMATGCAIVTSDSDPQQRLLGDAAVFVPSNDSAALIAAIRGLAADRKRTADLGRAARSVADERLSPAAVAGRLWDAAVSLPPRGAENEH